MDRNPQYKPEKKYPLWGSFVFAGFGMLASGVGVDIFMFYCYSGNMLTLISDDTMPGVASIKLPLTAVFAEDKLRKRLLKMTR